MREIQYKTPDALMQEDDSAIRCDISSILPQTDELAILIKLNEQGTEFLEAGLIDLSKPHTVIDIIHPIPEANKIWHKPQPLVKTNEPLTVGLIGCDALLESFNELKKSGTIPTITWTRSNSPNQQVEVTTKLDVRNHQNRQYSDYHFIAVDCTNAHALHEVERFKKDNYILDRRRIVLTPIKYMGDDANNRKITPNDVKQFAKKNNCIYANDLLQMNWDDIFNQLTGRPTKAEAAKNDQLKITTAKQEINRLITDLENEVNRSAFIRFFTDFNNTKAIKLGALNKIKDAIENINDFDVLSKTVNDYIINHPQKDKVLFTTKPLTSRTATLISEITENNGDALLKHELKNVETSTPNA